MPAPNASMRTVLRLLSPLLPRRWRDIARLLAVKPAPTPGDSVAVEIDEAANRLGEIEHIVVLMLENRSFDHMLGYLSLPRESGGAGRGDVEGLAAGMSNSYREKPYEVKPLTSPSFPDEDWDPDHSSRAVDRQIDDGRMDGFASSYGDTLAKRGVNDPEPGLAMGYYGGEELAVFDFLAEHFAICDHWFSSVPGATWPNRLYAVAGRAAGLRDDLPLPLYNLPTFFRFLDRRKVEWRWYSFDPATLRLIDPEYRFGAHHHFAFFDKRKLSLREEAMELPLEERPSFLDDAANGNLAPVSWVDPRFKDARMLGPDSNDDHPPTDVTAGQDLVLTLYHALRNSPAWERTLLLVTYDEHGGLFDHVPPPDAPDDDPAFRRYGVRVPALVVSPWVEAGSTARDAAGKPIHFDHTSIIKTILLRFCAENGQIPDMGQRVTEANHLGQLLASEARTELPGHGHLAEQMTTWRSEWTTARFGDPQAKANAPRRLNDLQDGFVEAARRLRAAGLPAGHP